jgi:hypothetical protein
VGGDYPNNGGTGAAGTVNTGGGGGGGSAAGVGSNGGSGFIALRYLGPQRMTGGTYSLVGGYSIHVFNTSASLQT